MCLVTAIVLIEKALSEIFTLHTPDVKIIASGDLNVNLLVESDDKLQLLNCFASFGLRQTVFEATRLTSHSNTCIDNIFSNLGSDICQSQVLPLGFSDHEALFLRMSSTGEQPQCFKTRNYSRQNTDVFCYLLSHEDWGTVLPEGDPNKKFYIFLSIFCNYISSCFPLARRTNSKLCSSDLLADMRETLNLIRAASRMPGRTELEALVSRYKAFYLKTEASIQKARYNQTIHKATNRAKSIWKVISTENGKRKSHSGDDSLRAEDRNIYFANIGKDLLSNKTLSQRYENVISMNERSCFFNPCTPHEIHDILLSLKSKNTEDIFGISVKIIKAVAIFIAAPISDIINTCMSNGCFADRLKIEKILPVHKKVNRKDPGNYRPIAILPAFTKVF